jgi:hypothetical protein
MRWMIGVFVVACVGLAFAGDSVKVIGRGQKLILTVGSTRHIYTLSEARIGVDMDEVSLVDVQHKNGLTYVVLTVYGPSRRNGGAHECGAGYESSLVWLRLKRWHLLEIRSVKYESCWYSLESDAPPKRRGSLYTIAFSDFGAMKDKTVTYDRAHPELAFALTGSPMPALK